MATTIINHIFLLLLLPLLVAADENDEPPKNAFGNDMFCPSFTCSAGYTPTPKSGRPKFTSGGCASMGAGTMMMYGGGDNRNDEFWPCCHQWHACYQVCGVNKRFCDNRFTDCATLKCGLNDKCKKGSELKMMLITMAGCEKFEEFQNEVCKCVTEDKAVEPRGDAIMKFYKKFAPESLEKAKGLTKKVETHGKFSALFLKLLEKYPDSIKYVKDNTADIYEKLDRMMKQQDDQEKKEETEKLDNELYDVDDDDFISEEEL